MPPPPTIFEKIFSRALGISSSAYKAHAMSKPKEVTTMTSTSL